MANQQTFNIQCEVHLVEMHFILRVENDTQTGIPSGIPEGAMCVQRFDDSLNSAIHITYRISLRSSSMREPRDPLLKVVSFFCKNQHNYSTLKRFYKSRQGNFHSLDLECTGDM